MKVKVNQKVVGTIKRHPDGYGFFIPEDAKLSDVYVAKHSMGGAMSNDRVEVLVKREGDRFRGEIVRIVSRETKKVTGQLHKINNTQGLLLDESFSWGEDIKISWGPHIQLKDKDWVVVNIVSYVDSPRGLRGEVETVIGDISDPQNDNVRVLSLHNIPHVFSKKTLEEAGRLPPEVTEKDWQGRKDLRGLNFITIDGKTAKDFDDAVYVEKMKNGFRLWVAIADVSHYVREGSAIDEDAYIRGTSTYFPNFVSPMLPEALSNELCSLKPNVPRLSLVCEMDMDFNGVRTRSVAYEAVIQSQARVTYGEAQEVLDGEHIEKLKHVRDNIKLCGELANILMRKRFNEGSLNLEIPESVIELLDSGVPSDIIRSDRLFAHRLIEELMLAANVAVAELLKEKNAPAIFRIHEPPKQEALETLERFLDAFGYTKRLGNSQLQKRITQALEYFHGEPQEVIVNTLALRSMNQAKYSPKNVGHFGLGFDNYTHFTSPIRRYPDLIVHRLLKASFGVKGYRRLPLSDLEEAGTMLSACEQRSVKAERQINAIKKARFLEKHLGKEFEGMVTSVTKFGLFVTLRQFEVDGLVRVEALGKEHYEFDEENLRLRGRRSGHAYTIGDMVKIQVAAADHQIGRIDFVLATGEEEKDAPKKKDQSFEKRRPPAKDSRGFRSLRVSGHHRKDKSETSERSGKAHSRRHK